MRTLLAIISVLFTFNLCSAFSNYSSSCGQTTFTDIAGTVRFSGAAVAGKSCTYDITTSSSTRLVLRWTSFDIYGEMPRCSGSTVAVYLGCKYNRIKLIDFCSRNIIGLPHDIYTTDNCLRLVFSSSQSRQESFTATYRGYSKSQPVSSSRTCSSKKNLYAKSDIIYSPLWPNPYPSSWFDCEWNIKMPSDYLIKLSFMDLDIRKSYFSSCSSNSDRLKLKGEKSALTSLENKEYFCSTRSPFTRTTRYYELELEFRTGVTQNSHRGFMIGYIAYRTPESSAAAKSMTIGGYIGIVFAFIIIVTCCGVFLWCRRRRAQNARGGYVQAQPAMVTSTVDTKSVSYGTGQPPMTHAPPSYSSSMSQAAPPYQAQPMYPANTTAGAYPPGNVAPYPQQHTGPYPSTPGQPYPPTSGVPIAPPSYSASGAPYPAGGASYPAGEAPYPSGGAPYPAGGAPYPSGGAPYPSDGAPYPTGTQTTTETKQASAPPM